MPAPHPKLSRLCGVALTTLLLAACSGQAPRPDAPPVSPVEPAAPPLPSVTPPAPPPLVARFLPAEWGSLPGWGVDDQLQAWHAFVAGCAALRTRADWKYVCELARQQPASSIEAARAFFETQFDAYRVVFDDGRRRDADEGLVTGYYEPLLRGARSRGDPYRTPLYGVPEDLLTIDLGELYPQLRGERLRGRLQGRRVVPYYERAQLEGSAALRGKELVWIDDPVDAFFLQIQGSGRVQLTDGNVVRLAYADVNGHPYRAIGRYLVERGELTLEQATAPGIREWLRQHPERVAEVLNANPSVVFFREEKIADPALGPKGALGVPLSAGRSLAIDPRHLPLGAPLYLATTQPGSTTPLLRLAMAQDTGGAIRGVVRADLYWGTGPEAGEQAGNMRQAGRLWLLWPKGRLPPEPPPA